MKALGHLEVWLAAGSQDLYGEEVLTQVDEHAQRLAEAFDAEESIPVRVVAKPVLRNAESIRALCLAANADPACIGLAAWMHTFSPAQMWIAGLAALQKPLLHLHTQFDRDLPWARIDMDFMNLHQSAHGDREFGFLETRMRRARKTVVGHWQDAEVVRRIAAWTRAATGWSEAQSLTVLRFGDNMRRVAVTEGDKVEAQIRLVTEYEDAYELAPALARDGERRESLREAARIEAGLRSFLEAHSARAFTDTFEDLDGLKQLPGLAVQRLMADGYGFAAEGDWKTAALVRIAKVMSAGLEGGTSFMEDYTYDLAPGDARVLGAHMLEVCPSIGNGRPRCEIHPLSIGGRDDPVRLVFTAAAGPAVVVGLLDLGTRFRLVANEIEIVPPEEEPALLPVARAVWRPKPSLAVAAEGWLEAGGPHHTVLSRALTTDVFADFAEIAGIELVAIDERTTVGDLKKELRWNSVYYHLAQGL